MGVHPPFIDKKSKQERTVEGETTKKTKQYNLVARTNLRQKYYIYLGLGVYHPFITVHPLVKLSYRDNSLQDITLWGKKELKVFITVHPLVKLSYRDNSLQNITL